MSGGPAVVPIVSVVALAIATSVIGAFGLRVSRTTSDFFVASRTVHPALNASAICGEYLSAGTFLGLAGLVMVYGVDMLWYPVGFTVGYLVLLLFVAAPLRRFGAYTIPEFAEGRLDSRRLRRVSTVFVLAIGWLYLLPQMKGAGIALTAIAGTPYWVGVVVVGVVVTANVAFGGMRGITLVQAFQYWVKLVAISIPALVLLFVWQASRPGSLTSDDPPTFRETTTVELDRRTGFDVAAPLQVDAVGTVDRLPVHGTINLDPGEHQAEADTRLRFTAGTPVPHASGLPASDGAVWVRPFGPTGAAGDHPLYRTYAVIVATFLGTMGLPHILVRFYTNPDGVAARRTTVIVLALLGIYYAWPPVYGVLGRLYTPDLLLTDHTDGVVLTLPGRAVGGLAGEVLTGLVATGAFAAFLSTSSGLLISVASAISHDLTSGGVPGFRRAAVLAGAVAVALGLQVAHLEINVLVGWAFAIAASSFSPMILLGIWWRRLTAPGAAAGMLVGGCLSSAAIIATMAGIDPGGWPDALLAQPAAWSAPAAFATTIMVSLMTVPAVPTDVHAKLVALHRPEALRPT